MTRILVVDDDAAVRRVVTEALLEDGYQVDAACNAGRPSRHSANTDRMH